MYHFQTLPNRKSLSYGKILLVFRHLNNIQINIGFLNTFDNIYIQMFYWLINANNMTLCFDSFYYWHLLSHKYERYTLFNIYLAGFQSNTWLTVQIAENIVE